MLYHFILPLKEYLGFLRLFQYITFRSAYAALTSLLLVLILGNLVIRWLRALKFGEEITRPGSGEPQAEGGHPHHGRHHHHRRGARLDRAVGQFHQPLPPHPDRRHRGCSAALGFADDYIKSILKRKEGVSARVKLLVQIIVALAVALLIYYFPSNKLEVTTLYVPFINEGVADMGLLWVFFAVIVIVSTTNAVNLTDGLDGLAIGSVMTVGVSLGIMAYLTGHSKISAYLRIPYIPEAAELTVFLAALMGAALGFLWFNSNPATVFMGDTGSLALGGIIGIVAVMIKKEIFLFIVGGVFVVEVLSVIIQVASFKLRGKRVFKMAPLHHHFELSGWSEQKVVVRMWILGIILAILGLSSLKIL